MEIPPKGLLQSTPLSRGVVEEHPTSSALPVGVLNKIDDKESVSLTRSGREIMAAVQQAQSLPDVREDRVMRLKHQLEQGTYRIEGHRIAANMIDEALENNHLLNSIDDEK